MEFPRFNFARIPLIIFGAGKLALLPNLISQYGTKVLFITGGGSYKAAGKWELLSKALVEEKLELHHEIVHGEPTPEFVDEIAAKCRQIGIKVVVAIGGGSAVDAGKAMSAMIPESVPVATLLEGIGTGAAHKGQKVPFIAVPTTAGTGSEATKNAVLRRIGPEGFKNSLRHENLVPDIALIDPELHVSCPREVTAACGLDAFTQLLEAYTSNIASPITDALAFSGIEQIQQAILETTGSGALNVEVRARMAYGALLSGITLANAGLGIVHGFASPIGGFFDIPHGVVCGTLLASATRVNIEVLKTTDGGRSIALEKYARVGNFWATDKKTTISKGCDLLVHKLQEWVDVLKIPKLGNYGVRKGDIDKILAKTGNKNNPIALTKEQMREILEERL